MNAELTFLFMLVAFWVVMNVVGRILRLSRYGLEVHLAFLIYRSEGLKKLLLGVSRGRRQLWVILGNVGIALSVGLMVYSVYFLVNNLLRFIYPVGEAMPIFPVLPGVTIRVHWFPYLFTAVAIAVITHELAHGVFASAEGVPVKSTGFLILLVFFGGFVAPDEKAFRRVSTLSKLRILAAGSSTNLIIGLLAVLLLMGLFAPASGVLVYEMLRDGPAERAGLRCWDVIHTINGTAIFTVQDLGSYMANITPGEKLLLGTSRGDFLIITGEVDGRAIIGFTQVMDYYPSRLGLGRVADMQLHIALRWISLVSISVAVFNMLPTYPCDGEKFLYHILEKTLKRGLRELRVLINVLFWSLILMNMMLSFIKYGLVPI